MKHTKWVGEMIRGEEYGLEVWDSLCEKGTPSWNER